MGHQYGTQRSIYPLYRAVQGGLVASTTYISKEGERLDQIAGRYYGDGGYWWVIAAASGIGWGMQIPPGIMLIIPTNIAQVEALVS
ncbi:MAG: hypothetical protein CMB80_09345 [Flammeovirgaceae bacterium]|nr:hypothetical protein [Flammeovirgaceae bacterium]